MNMARHFNHRLKNRMLITRLICIQWKFTKPDQLASPSKFGWSFAHKDSSFFRPVNYSQTLVLKYSTLSSDRFRGTTRCGKARHILNNVVGHVTIFIPSFHGHRQERLGLWFPFWRAHTKNKKRRNACIFKVSLLKQARLKKKKKRKKLYP